MAVNPFSLPASSIALLFALALGFTDAKPYAEPVETLVYRADEWSPRPTGVPNEPSKLFKRSSLDVAICGWLGGDEASPAQCSSGSSCVHDTIHGVVGCCTTAGACLQGVYTTCLDYNSAGWASTPVVKNDGVTNWYVGNAEDVTMYADYATALEPLNAIETHIRGNTFNTRVENQLQRPLSRLLTLANQLTPDYK